MTSRISNAARVLVFCAVAALATTASAQWTTSGNNIYNSNTANVGIGTSSPSYKLDVNSGSARFGDGGSFYLYTNVPATSTVALRLFVGNLERMTILGTGNVGIGVTNPTNKLEVNGNVSVTGSITGATVIGAVYQDVAEWVPSAEDLEPGTVVVLKPDVVNEVMTSWTAYDTTVAGVVSAQPGVLLGVAGKSKEQIATTGRVKVRVDASQAPIKVGDLLVTSNKRGMAMRSEPARIDGRAFHQPGTIIGKALEPLAAGQGEILVLLSLQ